MNTNNNIYNAYALGKFAVNVNVDVTIAIEDAAEWSKLIDTR
jgi:hypothetical protein